jgi:hypothetical protein
MGKLQHVHVLLLAAAILLAALLIHRTMQGSPTPASLDPRRTYQSLEERKLPCGNVLRKTVEARDGAWAKTVTLLSPEGRVLKTKTRSIEPETCSLIANGKFVPRLWADCRVDLEEEEEESDD